MIVRIVKMEFRPEEVKTFLALFAERKSLIRNFPGCEHLELWQDEHQGHTFFTYSVWQSEQFLDHYRFSELFRDTWDRTKVLFSAKPSAWSVSRHTVLP